MTRVQKKKDKIFQGLLKLCRERFSSEGVVLNADQSLSEECWPKTREIADDCDESIYVTRNWLLKLNDEGKVVINDHSHSLRWFVSSDEDDCSLFN